MNVLRYESQVLLWEVGPGSNISDITVPYHVRDTVIPTKFTRQQNSNKLICVGVEGFSSTCSQRQREYCVNSWKLTTRIGCMSTNFFRIVNTPLSLQVCKRSMALISQVNAMMSHKTGYFSIVGNVNGSENNSPR